MSEAKHTTGPWSLDYDTDSSPNIWIVAARDAARAAAEKALGETA